MLPSRITVHRETFPIMANRLSYLFVHGPDVSKEDLCRELHLRMLHCPESTLVLTARDEHHEVIGFAVIWDPEGRDYIWVDQIWHDPKLSEKRAAYLCNKVIDDLKAWATIRGKSWIRMQSPRHRAWAKKYGFEEVMVVMQKEVK